MREHRNLTQEHVAEQLGSSSRTYRRLEYKDGVAAHLLTLKRLKTLSLVLEAPLAAFFLETPGDRWDISLPLNFQDYESLKKENAQLSERLHAAR
jgi:transcriptional regulator with XRE-family HTH domain